MAVQMSEGLRHHDRLQTLNEIGRVVSATLDLHALYETIYEQIGRVMDTSQFYIALLQADGEYLHLPYYREEGQLYPAELLPFGGNVTSLVIQRGEPLLFPTDDDYVQYAGENGVPDISVGQNDSESKIWVPLNTGNRTIGALSVQSAHIDAFTHDDMQTLAVIASQAAVAIENARLFAASQENLQQMHALLEVARSLDASLDLQTVLDSILYGIQQVLPYYAAAILLPNPRNAHLDFVGLVGPKAGERRHLTVPLGEGVTGRVFASGESLSVPDVRAFPGYLEYGHDEVRAEIAVPLRRGETIVGVLDVERTEVRAFSDRDLDLLLLFASQAAIAIENARLFSEQQERVFELQTIQSIVQKLTPLHHTLAIGAVIHRELKQLVDYHSCRIFMVDDVTGTLQPIGSGDGNQDLFLQLGQGLAGWVAEKGQPTIVPNTLEDVRVSQIAGTPRRPESMMAVPLIYQGRIRGVVTLSKLDTYQFDQNSLRLLEIVAAQAAIAFDRALLYDKLRTEAITDPVTKLYNRRHLYERFREELSRALRNGHSLTAIMLDIDKFKRVNDTYGHDAGDVVLCELAKLIRKVVRTEDLVARHGGEEFCILLPEIPLADAECVAERLRTLVAETCLPAAAGCSHITVSLGVAVLEPGETDHEIFTRADQAMYAVKRRGGNQVGMLTDDETRFPSVSAGEARS
ncbi:MAG: diguanylate cyclase [Chloroflexota bacterium]